MNHPSSAIDYLYVDNLSWLRQLIYRRIGCNELAADLAQDTFLRLLRKPQEFDSQDGIRAWLSRVAQGLCVDHWRHQEVERTWLETLATQPEDHALSAEQQAILVETIYELDSMLSRLPEKIMQTFLLSQLHGKTYREISSEMGISERTVKNYMAKAMSLCLRVQLELETSQ
ncbi:sigma-70 family RNA polymerase sigma factor [Methylophaga thalassica]|jgi:RNA polymerase sigma factor (sigma-70 family)|uniref:sigma-70 family RNA polymerase sigma factor n=1 Tax=Methylophaga aminisulfidivorans TaxID=230105 RepID=UPI003A90BF6A